jgi:hypothetical protein
MGPFIPMEFNRLCRGEPLALGRSHSIGCDQISIAVDAAILESGASPVLLVIHRSARWPIPP